MKITSVKNKKKLEITYLIENNAGGFDERVIKSGEQPRPEFYDTMKELRGDAHTIMEMEESKKERLYLTGLKFTHHSKESIGITMEGVVLMERASIYRDFKTYEVFTAHPGKKDILPEQILSWDNPMQQRIVAMLEEVERFIKGERAQTDIFKNEE